MSSRLPGTPAHQDERDADHNFLPDFAWAAVGGVVLVTCILVLALSAGWGGMRLGPPMAGGGVTPISTYYSELAACFIAGFLVVLVARSLSTRTR